MNDFYQILEVAQISSQEEIKKAYRKMARKWHPDTNMGNKEAEAKFKEILEAYDTLKDVRKRGNYDLSSKKSKKSSEKASKAKASEDNDFDVGASYGVRDNSNIEYKFFSVLVTIFSISLMFVLFLLVAARNKDHPAMAQVVKVFEKIDGEKVKNAFDKFGELHLTAENLFKETTEVDNPFKQMSEDKKQEPAKQEKAEEKALNENKEKDIDEQKAKIELLEKSVNDTKQVKKAKIIYTKGVTVSGKDKAVAN